MGGALDEAEFTRFSLIAEMNIDTATQNRVHQDFVAGYTAYQDRVKACVFELIFCAKDFFDGKIVTSESNNGISQSFQPQDFSKKANEVCNLFLLRTCDRKGTPLLYLGVC